MGCEILSGKRPSDKVQTERSNIEIGGQGGARQRIAEEAVPFQSCELLSATSPRSGVREYGFKMHNKYLAYVMPQLDQLFFIPLQGKH